jgi:NAD(P)H-hydrate epimerase
MLKIVTVEEMRAIEAAADRGGVSYAQMMDTAGRAVADRILQIVQGRQRPSVVVLVGPGNNGGDGLVAGRLVAEESDAMVSFYLARPRNDENFQKVQASRLKVIEHKIDATLGYRELRALVAGADVIVDALLGTGAKLPIREEIAAILQHVNRVLEERAVVRRRQSFVTAGRADLGADNGPVVVAVDLPTGMDADSGELDADALHAHDTVTFEAAKAGHLAFPAASAVGTLHVAPLRLPPDLKEIERVQRTLVTAPAVRVLLPPRPVNANKGTFGRAMIVGGSENYIGACVLAALGAYRAGAGLVTVAAPSAIIPTLAANLLEATWLPLPYIDGAIARTAIEDLETTLFSYTAALAGPGMGTRGQTREFIRELVQVRKRFPADNALKMMPLVIDADGLNLLAMQDKWWEILPPRTILTPHPGEMARLADMDTKTIQAHRLEVAGEKAAAWKCVVVLKGAFTVIADPDRRIAVLPFAEPALARAGTGDVLAGVTVGLLAQRLDPFDAALAAGYIHGYAGTLAARNLGTRASVLASDVAAALPEAIAEIEAAVD